MILGWYLLPLAVTVAAFVDAERRFRRDASQNTGGMFNFDPLIWVMHNALALIVSLIAWLAWAVLA